MNEDPRNDTSMEWALSEWGQSLAFPETPDVAAGIGARLRAPSRSWLRALASRPTSVLGAAFAAALVTALVVVLLSTRSTSSRHEVRPSAVTILSRAAAVHPNRNQITHLRYRVVVDQRHPLLLNLWEEYTRSSFRTAVVRTVGGRPAAVRFVERNGVVRRTWSSRPLPSERSVLPIFGAPPVDQDGRLLAQLVIGEPRRSNSAVRKQRTSLEGRRVYKIRVRRAPGFERALTLYYDARTYTLLREDAPGFRSQLVRVVSMPLSSTPQLVVEYLHAHKSPTSAGAATAY